MDDLLTPLERNIKLYLQETIATDLSVCVAELALVRPVDAHVWLAAALLRRGPHAGKYRIVDVTGMEDVVARVEEQLAGPVDTSLRGSATAEQPHGPSALPQTATVYSHESALRTAQ